MLFLLAWLALAGAQPPAQFAGWAVRAAGGPGCRLWDEGRGHWVCPPGRGRGRVLVDDLGALMAQGRHEPSCMHPSLVASSFFLSSFLFLLSSPSSSSVLIALLLSSSFDAKGPVSLLHLLLCSHRSSPQNCRGGGAHPFSRPIARRKRLRLSWPRTTEPCFRSAPLAPRLRIAPSAWSRSTKTPRCPLFWSCRECMLANGSHP